MKTIIDHRSSRSMQAPKAPKRPRRAEDKPEEAPKRPQEHPKRSQEEPKRSKKANPNHKTTREPNQDDFKTVLDPQGPSKPQFGVTRGAPFGRPNRHQNGTQNDAKTKRKFKSQKNRSKTILDSSWGDLGPSWAPSWADLDPKIVL